MLLGPPGQNFILGYRVLVLGYDSHGDVFLSSWFILLQLRLACSFFVQTPVPEWLTLGNVRVLSPWSPGYFWALGEASVSLGRGLSEVVPFMMNRKQRRGRKKPRIRYSSQE